MTSALRVRFRTYSSKFGYSYGSSEQQKVTPWGAHHWMFTMRYDRFWLNRNIQYGQTRRQECLWSGWVVRSSSLSFPSLEGWSLPRSAPYSPYPIGSLLSGLGVSADVLDRKREVPVYWYLSCVEGELLTRARFHVGLPEHSPKCLYHVSRPYSVSFKCIVVENRNGVRLCRVSMICFL